MTKPGTLAILSDEEDEEAEGYQGSCDGTPKGYLATCAGRLYIVGNLLGHTADGVYRVLDDVADRTGYILDRRIRGDV